VPRIGPFSALTYDAAAGPLGELTAPPYDVISEPNRDRFRGGSPYNIVHLDLASDDPVHTGDPYEWAADRLRRWIDDGILVRSPEPAYFVYEMTFPSGHGERTIRGLFCAMDLEPWGGGVLPHEETMPGPVEDRLRLLRATATHLSPIYGVIAGPNRPLAELIDGVATRPAPWVVRDDEGVRHRMWRAPKDAFTAASLASEPILIADGHHRYTTALAYRDERRAEDGPGPWDRILTLLVDAGEQEVSVLPYHRLQITGAAPDDDGTPATDGHDLDALLDTLDDATLGYAVATPDGDGGLRVRLRHLHGHPPTVAALHAEVLDRIAPGDAIRFTHDAEDAAAAIRSGAAVAAYLLPRTSPERILAVVERGERLPRKSTFFWPKPRTGMVLMPVDR